MENESCIKEIISNSLNQVRTIIDADTVVGKQIVTPGGTVIIPISKVSMGFASGGLDLPAKKGDEDAPKNFGGGGGTGVTVSPLGFLIVTPDGRVEMLPMVQEKSGPIDQIADILERTPEIIDRVKSVFTGNTDASEAEDYYSSKLSEDYDDCDLELTRKERKELKKQQKAEKKAARDN